MNKYSFLLFAIFSAATVKGQVAKWLIPPAYDGIHMAIGSNHIITDSVNCQVLWSSSGKRLACTPDQLFPFAENLAITTKQGTANLVGFYDTDGKFTQLTGLDVAHAFPYFSDGYLLVQEGYFYRFLNAKGELEQQQYAKAYPFSNGYASCCAYRNIQKRKDPYNLLVTKDHEQVFFRYGEKQFDADDLEFISSVNDEQIAVVVAKRKVYFFDGKTRSLKPVFARKDESNAKNQAKLDDDLSLCLTKQADSTSVLEARCGKEARVQIRFDRFCVPLSFTTPEGEYTYQKKAVVKPVVDSPLKMVSKDHLYGINWEYDEMLPPQFDELISCFGDRAFVRLSGKCGMLKVYKDENFRITINKGNPIDFRHQKYETTIRLDLPKAISATNSRIDVNPESGCQVDMPSGVKKDTEYGNYIQYNCVLNIPYSLPDEMYGDARNEITYPVQVCYDGLKSPIISLKVMAWHYKYFNVDVSDAETSISKGDLSFTFNINAERMSGEAVYPTSVNVLADSLTWELEKISETRYKCKVLALREGTNNIVVQILEQGCPPAAFPFEVTYTRPSAKGRNKSGGKEDVVIKKKTRKAGAATTPTPHLEI